MRNIQIIVSKPIRNYRNRGKSGRYTKMNRNNLWGKLSRTVKYGRKKTIPNRQFSTKLLKEVYGDLFYKNQAPNTPESGVVKKKLEKWMQQRVKRNITSKVI